MNAGSILQGFFTNRYRLHIHLFAVLIYSSILAFGGTTQSLNVLSFYTARNDAAHVSFVNEANMWFAGMARKYVSNTWRPTSAILKVENRDHPATSRLPSTITSSPNECYRWEKDLRSNPDIDILLSIDPESFPLGTGPKPHEIWHSAYYPVVWTNNKYRMVYFNMGHNDIDYENRTNEALSHSFSSSDQNRLILDALWWLGGRTHTLTFSTNLHDFRSENEH